MSRRILTIAVIYGGASGEHEVSLLSARSVIAALDRSKYVIRRFLIGKDGAWRMPDAPKGRAVKRPEQLLRECDVAFPLVHGTGGEDGALQGYLETVGVPYVGSGVLGSAVGMDKAVQKQLLAKAGFPIAPFLSFAASDWETSAPAIIDRVERELGYPSFVKPANLGSSVGIAKAHHRKELRGGIEDALAYDHKVVVERAVPNAREIECAVIGNETPRASVLGEIVPSNEFYDYEAKYLSGRSAMVIPAKCPKGLSERIRGMALGVYRTLDAAGMARVDFLMDGATGAVYVNEINTIPGFTAMSMFPKLWEATDLPYPRLLDEAIALALSRAARRGKLRRSYAPPGKKASRV